MGERRESAFFVKLKELQDHAMPWWTSLLLFFLSLNLWLSGRKNPDEVIGLLEKMLAALLVVVVLLDSRNVVLESLALLAVLQLPALPRRPF